MAHKTRNQLKSRELSLANTTGLNPVLEGGREYEYGKWVARLQQLSAPGAVKRFIEELQENRSYGGFSDELDKVAKKLARGDENLGLNEKIRLASLAKSLKEIIFIMKCADRHLSDSFLKQILEDAAFKEDTVRKLMRAVDGLKPGTRREHDRFSWLSPAERSEFATRAESVLGTIK